MGRFLDFIILGLFCNVISLHEKWLDSRLPIDERVSALLKLMTNEEKMAQTIHLTGGDLDTVIETYQNIGLGAFPMNTGTVWAQNQRNKLQTAIMNTSRLHIPVTFHAETLHNSVGRGTIFPMPVMQGATWNTQLVGEIAATIALEAWAAGIDRGFSPEINVCTDARFGRTEENFGEDPALVSAMGVAAVHNLHGGNVDGPSSYLPVGAIISEAKHAAAYAVGGKDGMAADISDRTLHDIYLRPWKEYAEAGGRGAMLAHNSINQIPCHSSKILMSWLRAQGTMNGSFFASDMCDIGLLRQNGFGTAENLQDAATQAMSAGLDQELCNPTDGRGMAYPHVVDAVKSGQLSQIDLDRAAGNILRSKFAAGLFDGRAYATPANLSLLDSPKHRALARQTVHEGAVLLKNSNGVLPLQLNGISLKTIAIVGPLAGCPKNDSCDVLKSYAGGYTSMGAPITSVLEASYNETGIRVLYAPGCAVGGNDTSGFATAVSVSEQADVIIFVGGDSGNLGWLKATCGENEDRTELDLPGVQVDLLTALAKTGKPLVAILIHGRPVTFVKNKILNHIDAVIAAWRPGCEAGVGLWDLLSGRVNPSGRLAQSWVRSAGYVHSQSSPWFHLRQGLGDHAPWIGDKISTGLPAPWTPQFAFGFGLSYTTFNLSFSDAYINNDMITINIEVKNIGNVPGKQAFGIYFRRGSGAVSTFVRYHKMLLTFTKTKLLQPEETQTLIISVSITALASYDPNQRKNIIEKGEYELVLGSDSFTEQGKKTIVIPAT